MLGQETYTYHDGEGRIIEVRDESQTPGVFRVSYSRYGIHGQEIFTTLPQFESGTNSRNGSLAINAVETG